MKTLADREPAVEGLHDIPDATIHLSKPASLTQGKGIISNGVKVMDTLTAWQPRILSVLRMVSGLIFMLHGTQKLLGVPAGKHVVEAFSLPWTAGVIEIVCGLAILVGFMTRPAAFLASGTMAVAYWMAHAPRDVFPTNNGGDAAILYCFIFLYLVFAGPGPWSIDAMMKKQG